MLAEGFSEADRFLTAVLVALRVVQWDRVVRVRAWAGRRVRVDGARCIRRVRPRAARGDREGRVRVWVPVRALGSVRDSELAQEWADRD